MSKKLPVYSINVPNGGNQQPITIPANAPVYSSYTGKLVGYGPQPFGMPCDAPQGHPNNGKNYHVIINNPVNGSWMMHRNKGFK